MRCRVRSGRDGATAHCFIDPTAERDPEVYVHQDRYGEHDQVGNDEWGVEYMGSDGGCYVTIFAGPEAERERATTSARSRPARSRSCGPAPSSIDLCAIIPASYP